MNYVFALLVLVSVGVAAWKGSPQHDAVVVGHEVVVPEAYSSAKVGGAASVERDGVAFPAVVQKVEPGKLTLGSCQAPDGPATVTFGDEYAMKLVSDAAMEQAKKAVELAIGLVGAMTLFLGLMKIVEAGGGLDMVARAIRPVMVLLFPTIPTGHPAMGAMVMNIAANVLGLGNAATPFGIRAMQELDSLNKEKGTASNAMVLFLAINTSGVAVLPTGVMAVRAALGASEPASIFSTTLAASLANTVVAVAAAKTFQRFFPGSDEAPVEREPIRAAEFVPMAAAGALMLALVAWVYTDDRASTWIIPGLIAGMVGFGVLRRVRVYEVFIEGAKDGFQSAMRIIPYVVAILAAVGMFRASGALDVIVGAASPLARLVGLPPEVLPLALLRPLSGSGAFALTSDITKTYGPDSFIAQVAGTMQGTTETTFYVLAVYFGAVGINRYRHAVPTGIMSDLSGVIASVIAVRLLIGGS